ncbi:MAG: hypothetical protein U0K19_01625 [Bifidobacteriaceae bacterium]|nr:hypothetical protein [Bifidobacteriaceae bacterium]
MKNESIDVLIAVNMLLISFDVSTLNTAWDDKNLRMYRLIQTGVPVQPYLQRRQVDGQHRLLPMSLTDRIDEVQHC